ncbi:MAG: DUF5011 domain-containing protein [Acidobacteria bacterium]|nr:DUF5011 domain-containing protein [Acidobacteriota bacterium]
MVWRFGIFCALAMAAQESVSFVARDARAALLRPGGAEAVLPFTADPAPSGGDIFHCIVSVAGAEIALIAPSGVEINATNAEAQGYTFVSFRSVGNRAFLSGPAAIPGFHVTLELPPGAASGEYQIKAKPGAIASEATLRCAYNSSSPIRVALTVGQRYIRSGDGAAFSAMIFENTKPFVGAKATVRIRPRDDAAAPHIAEFELPDSGALNPTVGDGLYLRAWSPPGPGNYIAALRVTGVSGGGAAFSRLASAEFTVLKPLARIEAISDSAIDDNGDGLPDRVAITANVRVSTAGSYELAFNVRAGQRNLTSRTRARLEQGLAPITAGVSFTDLASLAPEGPYAITDVFLFHLDDPELPPADDRADGGAPPPTSRLDCRRQDR